MIVVIIFLLCCLILCSLLELSFSSLNIIKIKKMVEDNDKRAKTVYDLYQNYSDVTTTILVINCIAGILTTSITVYYFTDLYGDKAVGIVTAILTVIVLLFTEILPKIIGREYAEEIALRLSGLIRILTLIFTPINRIIRIFERKIKNNHKVTATKEELVEIVKTIKEEGVIEEKESNFIQKAVILKELKVENVMVEKADVSYLYDNASSQKVRQCVFRDKHDRIPIINKNNKIVGILYEVDLLDELLKDGKISIKNNIKEAICVSTKTSLASCLELLHQARAHMAIVNDKDNNFLGIVTIEDIVHELMRI